MRAHCIHDYSIVIHTMPHGFMNKFCVSIADTFIYMYIELRLVDSDPSLHGIWYISGSACSRIIPIFQFVIATSHFPDANRLYENCQSETGFKHQGLT